MILLINLFLPFFILLSIYGNSQNFKLTPVVDERTELLSIVFRLSGAEEFTNNQISDYTAKIDNCFNKFKDDKLILFAKKIRAEQSVSYDAVMSMAIHLELKNNVFKIKENISNKSLDSRWGATANEFIVLLNEFYKKTDFHKFFSDNKQLFKNTESRYTEVLNTIDLNWFEKYYGTKPQGTFNLIISLTNGSLSFGPKIINKNGMEDMYAIIGTYETDSLGLPLCSRDFAETVIHEFNHSFCNNLIDKFYTEMKTVSESFYNLVEEKMKNQAYGTASTMLYEILVRASVIKYFEYQGASELKINNMTSIELSLGFIWIKQLLDALTKYINSRNEYPTLEKYMPEIVNMQNSLNTARVFRNYDNEFPRLSSFSINNNCQDVDPKTKELRVTFDRPMFTGAYGINFGKCGKQCFPKITSVKWNPEKNYELIIYMELEPARNYSMKFPYDLLIGANGFILKETYFLDFKTK